MIRKNKKKNNVVPENTQGVEVSTNLETQNKEIATSSITIDNSVITENTFNDSTFIFNNPITARVASISANDEEI